MNKQLTANAINDWILDLFKELKVKPKRNKFLKVIDLLEQYERIVGLGGKGSKVHGDIPPSAFYGEE